MSKHFAETMLAAGVVFNRDVDELLIDVYMDTLAGYPLDDCASALRSLMKTSTFFPKPVEIISALQGSKKDQSLDAWPEVKKLASNSSEAKSDDPITEAVVSQMGGWTRLGRTPEKEWTWLEREFRERYERFTETPKLLENHTGKRSLRGPVQVLT